MYKRVLIKLSGEALGENGVLFDFEKINRVAEVIVAVARMGVEIALVLGGGNIWRGRMGPAANMDAVTADHMGMLGTAINSLAMQDAIERAGVETRVLSAVEMTRFAEPYIRRRAVRHLEKGRIVLFACGTGNPFFSTDTAAALRAVEIGADAILLAKSVDGVYDDDPNVNPNASFLADVTYDEARRRGLRVMDTAAFTICNENDVPAVHVFGLHDPENILRVAAGERLGSLVHP
ncbi:MAG: UMP kinase [Firmicutes bacterium]|nr:UMP kinase [Bacillota bacterium]